MRNLTFKGYITQQVKAMSSNNTISVYKLVKEASTTNPKLMEPLLLYVATCGKTKMLFAAAKKTKIDDKYLDIVNKYLLDINEKTLHETVSKLPNEFKVVYKNFIDAKNRNRANDPSKELYKNEILKIAKANNLSISAIAKKTGLKRGNAYRFFSKNQQDYLSVESLKRTLTMLKKEYPPDERG
ncbi:MAG: hypothetical protein GX892_17825 [Thermoanaerobacteraceae bacterium]|nr:hypothetical protein [Thermoanaerobacteraceae bacterium]